MASWSNPGSSLHFPAMPSLWLRRRAPPHHASSVFLPFLSHPQSCGCQCGPSPARSTFDRRGSLDPGRTSGPPARAGGGLHEPSSHVEPDHDPWSIPCPWPQGRSKVDEPLLRGGLAGHPAGVTVPPTIGVRTWTAQTRDSCRGITCLSPTRNADRAKESNRTSQPTGARFNLRGKNDKKTSQIVAALEFGMPSLHLISLKPQQTRTGNRASTRIDGHAVFAAAGDAL